MLNKLIVWIKIMINHSKFASREITAIQLLNDLFILLTTANEKLNKLDYKHEWRNLSESITNIFILFSLDGYVTKNINYLTFRTNNHYFTLSFKVSESDGQKIALFIVEENIKDVRLSLRPYEPNINTNMSFNLEETNEIIEPNRPWSNNNLHTTVSFRDIPKMNYKINDRKQMDKFLIAFCAKLDNYIGNIDKKI